MKMKGYKLIILILAFLLLHPDLSFAQANRNEAGFVTNLPVLPQKLDLLKVGNRISSFTGEYINDHSVIYNPTERKWHMYGIVNGEKSFIHLTITFLSRHAPEIIRDLDGKWYITLCGYEPERNGFSVWPLYWNDYLENVATSVLTPINNREMKITKSQLHSNLLSFLIKYWERVVNR